MKKIFRKLNVKISLYFFLISMILVLLSSYINYRNSLNLLMENKRNQTEQEVKSAGIYISSYLDKVRDLANLISMNNEIKMISDEEYNSFGSLRSLIEIIQKNDDIIKNISVISKDGKVISTQRDEIMYFSNVNKEGWYQKALKANNMAYINDEVHFSKNTGKVITISSEIKNDNNEHIGIILIDLSYKFIEEYISKMNFQDGGYGFIITSEEKIVFDTKQMGKESILENETYIKLAKDRMKTLDGNFVGAIVEIPGTDWSIAGVSLTENVDILTGKLVVNTISWAFFILLISILMSIMISKSITKPITSLIENIKLVDDSLSPIDIDRSASNEIVDLTKEFNLLLERISDLNLSVAKKEEAKRIFELKALQSQINPHFIYNTLDTIMWLVEFGDNEKAIEVTKSLGEILRKSLGINQDFVRLQEELNHAKNYMDIQKIRYDDKFEYNFDIAKEHRDFYVPKLILQPIIENSIYHGIRPKEGRSFINISSFIKEEDLFLTVEDNGIGIRKNLEDKRKNKLGGIGMANVDQRIKILCGEEYGIELSRDNDITRLVYRLKLKRNI